MKTSRLAVIGIILTALLTKCPALAQSPPAKPIVLKDTLTEDDPLDRLLRRSHYKVHQVELQKDQVYLIELESKAFDTYLRLEDAAGKVLGANDDISAANQNSRLGYMAAKTGKYRVVATSRLGSQTGPYQVTILPTVAQGKPIEVNDKLTAKSPKIQGQHYFLHSVDLQAGQVYRIEVESRDFAPLMQLTQGKLGLAQDQAPMGSPSRVIFAPEETGSYAVAVLAGPPGALGAYRFTMQSYEMPGRQVQAVKVIHPEAPPTVIYGQLRKTDPLDRVRKQSHAIVHEVPLAAGKAYSIDLKSMDFNAFVRLEDAQGKELASDDDSGGEHDAWLPLAPPRKETYRLIVTSFKPGQTGAYLLTVQTFASQEQVKQRHRAELQGVAWNKQGVLAFRSGAYASALEHGKRTLQWRRELYPEKDYPRGHPDLAQNLNNLGMAYKKQGEYGPALQSNRAAFAMLQKLFPEKDYPHGHSLLAFSLNNIAAVYQTQGEYGAALQSYRALLEVRQKLYPQKDFPLGHRSLADCLIHLGFLYYLQGESGAALQSYRAALEMRQQLYPTKDYPRGHADLANSLANLGGYYEAQREYGAALKYRRAALEMSQNLYPDKDYPRGHSDLATSLTKLGRLYYEHEEYGAALQFHGAALEMRQKLYPEKDYPRGHAKLTTSLNELGLIYQKQGEYGAALKSCHAALEMAQKLYPEKDYPRGHADLADSLANLGYLYEAQKEYGAALKPSRAALAMRQKLFPEKDYPRGHANLAASLNNLGGLYQSQLEYDAALTSYRAALAMWQKLYPEKEYPRGHASLAQTLGNLGSLYQKQLEYDAALTSYRAALAMRQKLYPEKEFPRGHSLLAYNLNNLGVLYEAQGQSGAALQSFRAAFAMLQKLYPEKDYPHGHSLLATSMGNLGLVYQAMGEYGPALKLHRAALEMSQGLYPEKNYPRGHPSLLISLNHLDSLFQAQGEYGAALQYCNAALEMSQRLYPEKDFPRGHPNLAISLNNLGSLHQERREYGAALQAYRAALEMSQKLYPEQDYPLGHPDLVSNLGNLGVLYHMQGEHDLALKSHRAALEMSQKLYPEKDFPRGHKKLAAGLVNLGRLAQAKGEDDLALKDFRQALEIYQHLTDQFADLASEAQALNFAANLPLTRDDLISISQRLPNQHQPTYRLLWNGRSLLTRLIERRHQDLLASGDAKTRALAGKLTSARQRLAHLLLNPLKDQDKNRELAEQLNRAKEDLEQQIAVQLKLERAKAAETTAPEQLQAALPKGAVFIDMFRYVKTGKDAKGVSYYGAFVLSKDQIQWVDLGEADRAEKDIADWRAAIAASERDKADLGSKHAERVGRQLWNKLRKVFLKDTHTLYLAAEGDLTRVPWGALPGDRAGTILLEDYTIVVVPHGPFLLQQLTRKNAAPGSDRLLLVGNVPYDNIPQRKAGLVKEIVTELARSPLIEGDKIWQALPGSAHEIEQIRKLAGVRAVQVIQGADATGERIRQELPQARTAQLSTHGFFADKKFRSSVLQADEKLFERRILAFDQIGERQGAGARNPLVMSGLVFAGANHSDTPERGILTADGIVGLDLRQLDLAVLSACETGLGEVAGGEGVYGLQRAFHVAGARQVVASLWHVDDAATAALMVLFYRKQWEDGLAPTDALRQAQLAIYFNPEAIPKWAKGERGPNLKTTVKATGQTTLAPPAGAQRTPARYWAAFVMSGISRPTQVADPGKK